jgi:hypothetical protein
VGRRAGVRAQDAVRQARHPVVTRLGPALRRPRASRWRRRARVHDERRDAAEPAQPVPRRARAGSGEDRPDVGHPAHVPAHVRVAAVRAARARRRRHRTSSRCRSGSGTTLRAYTLKEYVHLMDAGVGEASFLDRATAA